MSTKRLASK